MLLLFKDNEVLKVDEDQYINIEDLNEYADNGYKVISISMFQPKQWKNGDWYGINELTHHQMGPS